MSRSTFPDKVDTFTDLFDLPADLYTDATRFAELKSKANPSTVEQNEIKSLTDKLKDYMVTPESFNRLQDCINSLETFFQTNVRGYIADQQKIWAGYVTNFKYVGVWASSARYVFQNQVKYNGDLYLCLKDHAASTNNPPNKDTTDWVQISTKGDKGDIGLNAFYKGDWVNSTAYAIGDAVSFNNVVYIAKVASTGKTPTDTASWFPYQQILVVDGAVPTGLSANVHVIQYT
jgi:hypothetical protein